ncbi:hypothetical protein [Psychrobacter sp. ANT_WB68]|uniref:hypothetical protein n=1 Tax=Psychrobacter sp. ANT_WB68 TaxID=2597355 RepID=UPI0011F13CA8|nr:hypothetical protein [Psychrobacter sp. ANT_WB68]KAA0915823.1 hypothetical protein FQ084_04625 [Psychrobacter sp. ANT_WB68]
MAETEALRASIPQPVAQQPVTVEAPIDSQAQGVPDSELAASNKEIVNAANKEKREASNSKYTANKESIDASKKQICDSVTSVSETAMKARLNGVPIQTALAALDSSNNGSDAAVKINKMYTAIITDAYRQPNFSTDKYKEDAIREFALTNYLACIDAVAKW